MMSFAPICLFTYNRLEETKRTIQALQLNNLACLSELFIFSDGWKNHSSKVEVLEIRKFLQTIEGFKKISIYESSINKGLAKSIIEGVNMIISDYSRVIVLEDDLITTSNFLDFMNGALDFYKDNNEVFSISGYSMRLPSLRRYEEDFYIGYRASSWGWATWNRSWDDIDWEVKDYPVFKKSFLSKIKFNRGGSDMARMLKNQMKGEIDSWAIRWCYNQYRRNQYTIYPKLSKVVSIGFGEQATHTKKTKRFDNEIDLELKTNFIFKNELIIDKKLIREFKAKFSVLSRFKDKFL